jgi:ABC-type nitrate/sulfonate/bicarbonate transport system substrate-binding protein
MKPGIFALLLFLVLSPVAFANPYLPKAGERPTSLRVSTCAVSGGFVHLYTALDNGLFDKYGLKLENIFIRGSAQNLAALPAMRSSSPTVPPTERYPVSLRGSTQNWSPLL